MMRRLSKPRVDFPYQQVSFSENLEKSKKLYYSTLILMVKDKIEEKEQIPKVRSTDLFLSQLETMISRHSAQMDRVAQKAVDVRTNINSERKTIETNHSERMNKAKKQLKILQNQIKEQREKVMMIESHDQEKETEETNSKIETLNSDIEQYNFRIKILRNSTSDLKKQIEKTRIEFDSKESNLEQRRKNLDSTAEHISSQLESTIHQIRVVDAELKDLEQKEKICVALYESLKQPLPSIQRIFSNQ